jgi:BMFP domain-containing protein YqiC
MTNDMPDLSTKILTKIHDELRGLRADTNARFESLETRLEGVEAKLDVTNARLGVIEHTLVDFGTQVVFAGRVIKNVERCHDGELAELRERVSKLEAKPKRR